MIRFLSPLRFAFKGWYLLMTLFVALFYLISPVLLINSRILFLTVISSDPILFKLSFLITLVVGTIMILPPLEQFFTITTALLLGMNVSLLIQTINILIRQKNVTLTIGGASLLALAGAGCASCGISILSIVGISTPLLPLHGAGFLAVSTVLLMVSLFVILKNNEVVCRLN